MKPLTGLMARAEAALHSLQADGCVDRGGIANVIRELRERGDYWADLYQRDGEYFRLDRARLRKLIPGCDCDDPSQCWEPCGTLGHSAEHAVAVEGTNPDSTGTA